MKKWMYSKIPVLIALTAGSPFAVANTIVTIGEQDFADGSTMNIVPFMTASSGEPAPFDGVFIGSDVSGPNFSASWFFSYGPLINVTGANFILGIYDHESAATGNQVSSFKVNGIDLTAELNTLFESHGGGSREDNVYTLALPTTTFAGLESGSVNISLSLTAPGLGLFGETAFNGAALDFSALDISTRQDPPQTVPEPASIPLLLVGFSALIALRRKVA